MTGLALEGIETAAVAVLLLVAFALEYVVDRRQRQKGERLMDELIEITNGLSTEAYPNQSEKLVAALSRLLDKTSGQEGPSLSTPSPVNF
jgi:hypothetical protein